MAVVARGRASMLWPLPSRATSSCARLSAMCRKPSGSNIGSGGLLERIQQALQRGVGGAAAVGMAAHAVDDDQQRGLVRDRDGDAVLVVFAITDQTQICMLDPQARAPAGRPSDCYTSNPRRDRAGGGAL